MISRPRLGAACAALLLVLAASACGSSNGTAAAPAAGPSAAAALPSTKDAASIVRSLWSERETSLPGLDIQGLGLFDTGSARRLDAGYINAVQCGCEQAKEGHAVVKVIPQIPRQSSAPVFFAQVLTRNNADGRRVWYVVAVKRDGAGFWKFAFLTFGGYRAPAPLKSLTKSDGVTPPITSAISTRINGAANNLVRWQNHRHAHIKTSYGATVRRRVALQPSVDGIFGLALSSGKVLSCFTLHDLDTFSLKSGLVQGATRSQWGATLPTGTYRSITSNSANPTCVVGTGTGTKPGVVWMQYDSVVLNTTGIRLHH
jgi:hypothetical protein